MDKVTEVLTIAKELLEGEKIAWCQGEMFKYSDRHETEIVSACAVGAICLAVDQVMGYRVDSLTDPEPFKAHCELDGLAREALSKQIGGESIPGFNDQPETTKEDVLLIFKRAIADRQ